MATTVTVNSNYAGKDAGEYIGKAFKEADTLSKGLITVLPDIDFQLSVKKIAYSNGRQDYACGFTPAGSVTLSEKLLTPKKIKNELELCKEDFRQIWSSATMGFSAHNDNMPADVQTALLAEILADESLATETSIWQGDADNAGEFDGFIKLFTADANVIKANNGITPAAAAITKSNVMDELEKVYNAIPDALRGKQLTMAVSYNVVQAYKLAVGAADFRNEGNVGDKPLNYLGYDLVPVSGLPANTIVVFEKGNLFFGTGLLADHNEIRVKDMDETDLSGQVRYKMVYTAGVQYANSEDIIWYLSTTAVA